MPSLQRVLRDYDLGLLRVIAEQWGLELQAGHVREAADELAAQLRSVPPQLAQEVVGALPAEARAALDALRRERLTLAVFTRKYGELRAMGANRREREQPWRNAPSPAESLWYRGLIGRAFFDEGQGPQEFIFIPDDLLPLLPTGSPELPAPTPPGHPFLLPVTCHLSLDSAPDDVATLLAYLQIAVVRLEGASFPRKHREVLGRFLRLTEALDFFLHLAIHLGLASGSPLKLEPARARPFLEASRAEQVASLAPAWRDSREWNDLLHLPGLVFEGQAWRNDPFTARQAILDLFKQVPPGEWWSLEAFVAAVKDRKPDFQRPAGDYDSWYIRDAATQAYLRGFENWERVDGALVRWIIEKPMCWLGLVEIAPPPRPSPVHEKREQGRETLSLPLSGNLPTGEGLGVGAAFRLTPYAAAFFGQAPSPAAEGETAAALQISADGLIRVPASASRYDRFQVARISHWLSLDNTDYLYRLTPASLARAAKQGIRVSHLLGFLQKAAGSDAVPPTLVGALHRWERSGGEAALKETVVLKLKSKELLETLRRTPGVRRYLGEALGPDAVEVRKEDMERLRQALAEVGILLD